MDEVGGVGGLRGGNKAMAMRGKERMGERGEEIEGDMSRDMEALGALKTGHM